MQGTSLFVPQNAAQDILHMRILTTQEFYKSGKSNSRAGGRGIPTTPNRHDYQNVRIHEEKSDFAMKGCSLQEAEKKEKEKSHVAPQVPVYIRPHQVLLLNDFPLSLPQCHVCAKFLAMISFTVAI